DREDRRSGLFGERGPGRLRLHEDERALGRIDGVTAELEPRATAQDDVELLVALVLFVLRHQPIARLRGSPGIRSEGGDPEVVAHRPHVRPLPVVDVLQLVNGRDLVLAHSRPSSFPTFSNAATARSTCSSSIAADIWTRIRAVPSGTTGYPKPVTKTPSSSSRRLNSIANAVSPTMIGTIAASPSRGLKPSARRRSRNCPVWRCSFATSSGSRRRTRTASSAEHATVGGSAFEKSCGRERWARTSQTSSLAATKPPAAPPRAFPSVEVITSTSPRRPQCSATPRPVSPTTPVPCESSTTSVAACA